MNRDKELSRKKRLFDIIQIGNKDDVISRTFDYFIVSVIILNIFIAFLIPSTSFRRCTVFSASSRQLP